MFSGFVFVFLFCAKTSTVAFWFGIIYHLPFFSPELYLFCKNDKSPLYISGQNLLWTGAGGHGRGHDRTTENGFTWAVEQRGLGEEYNI